MTYIPEAHKKTVGNGEWEELLAPIDCNYYEIYAAQNHVFDKCLALGDSESCFSDLFSFQIKSPYFSSVRGRNTRWLAGERICWLRSDLSLRVAFLV